MPAFSYQALDRLGKTQRGVLQGDNARAVRASLRERGLNPLDVAPVDAERRDGGLFRRGLSSAQLALLTRQLATLLKAGLPIDEALDALAEQNDDARSRTLVVALRSRVMEGASLASALADAPESFPDIYRASIAAGEQSGRLDQQCDIQQTVNSCTRGEQATDGHGEPRLLPPLNVIRNHVTECRAKDTLAAPRKTQLIGAR